MSSFFSFLFFSIGLLEMWAHFIEEALEFSDPAFWSEYVGRSYDVFWT